MGDTVISINPCPDPVRWGQAAAIVAHYQHEEMFQLLAEAAVRTAPIEDYILGWAHLVYGITDLAEPESALAHLNRIWHRNLDAVGAPTRNAGNLIYIFFPNALTGPPQRERFLQLFGRALEGDIPGVHVLARGLNGWGAIRGTHMVLEICEVLAPGNIRAVRAFEIPQSPRGIDIFFDKALSLDALRKPGTVKYLECKAGVDRVLSEQDARQGLRHLQRILEGVDETPTTPALLKDEQGISLFRFALNTDKDAVMKQSAKVFLTQVLRSADQQEEIAQRVLAHIRLNTSLPDPPWTQEQQNQAIDYVADWFIIGHKVEFPELPPPDVPEWPEVPD